MKTKQNTAPSVYNEIMITRGQQATAQIVLDTILDLEPVNIFLERTALTRAASLKETSECP